MINYHYMRVMFVGGGTGGHFYPLIAVAEVLKVSATPPTMYYIGPTPYEAAELARLNISYVRCPAGKVRRYFSILNVLDAGRNLMGIFVAILKLYIIYPDVIFSKGGFTSVPVLLAARFLRIPVVIHESDAIPGRANLMARNFARYIAISYPEAASYFEAGKTALTGIPIRQALTHPPADPFAFVNVPNDRPIILVTGGSLGSEHINNIILRSLPNLLTHYRVFHLTGMAAFDEVTMTAKALITDPLLQSRYYIQSSVAAEVMAALYSAATLVVSRSGSTSLFEISLYGKPAVLIPIPESISRDQRTNAYAYARSGAASVIEQQNLTEHLLTSEIHSIIGDRQKYDIMRKAALHFARSDAATLVAGVLAKIGVEHES